MTEQKRDTDRI